LNRAPPKLWFTAFPLCRPIRSLLSKFFSIHYSHVILPYDAI
jgi:hypothetical protein